uniref:Protein kinase domain-containing protein n=1 Tax=Eutreptiella gymnastica TaxID=73025 RepID=A0A7S4LKW7_9EUGL
MDRLLGRKEVEKTAHGHSLRRASKDMGRGVQDMGRGVQAMGCGVVDVGRDAGRVVQGGGRKLETVVSSAKDSSLIKCDKCNNYKVIGTRCKFCGCAATADIRPGSAGAKGRHDKATSHMQFSTPPEKNPMMSCNVCNNWRHRDRDFVKDPLKRRCNDCYEQPAMLAGKWQSHPSQNYSSFYSTTSTDSSMLASEGSSLERKSSMKYSRPAGSNPLSASSFVSRQSSVQLNYGRWQDCVDLFVSYEQKWIQWGNAPITMHNLIGRKAQHDLMPISDDLSPRPLCDSCSEKAAEFACPPNLLPIECAQRHFACRDCYEQGYSVHRGMLGGKDREFNLTIFRQLFQQADVDNSGALDFLESLFCFVEAAKRLPWIFPPALRYTTTKLFRGAFNKYKGSPTDDTIDVDELEDLFQDGFRISVPDLKAIFAKHTNNHKSATYAQYLWILYHVARPNSEFLERMDAEKKQMHNIAKPKVQYPLVEEAPPPPDFPEFRKSKCKVLKMLGQGGMSIVWLIQYEGHKIAAKTPKANIRKRDKVEMFAAARAQMRIKHPNVLRVLGVHENSEWPCVLLELAEGGDVTEWYTQEANRGLQWKLALEVAQGMQALHEATPKLVHRDLKGENVFLTKAGTAKIADFDFVVKLEPPKDRVKGICGTPGFMAPEMLAGMHYDHKIDVFSYGSLLYEVTQQAFPFSRELEDSDSLTMEDWFNIAGELTLEGLRPKLNNKHLSPKMKELMHWCWEGDPMARPSFEQVCEALHELKTEFMGKDHVA